MDCGEICGCQIAHMCYIPLKEGSIKGMRAFRQTLQRAASSTGNPLFTTLLLGTREIRTPTPAIWVWVKIRPPGIGPRVLVIVSIYQGAISGTFF